MKYRLTVKGQVALATVALVFVFGVGSLELFTKPPTAEAPTQPTTGSEAIQTGDTAGAESSEPQPDATAGADITDVEARDIQKVIYFKPNRWEIEGQEIAKLTTLAEQLAEREGLQIVVAGNIHGAGNGEDTSFGEDLSQKRAQVVAEVLKGKGIPADRMRIISNGSANPVTTDAADSHLNRRTDVYLEGFPPVVEK